MNVEKSAETDTKLSFVEQQLLPEAYQLYNSKQYDKAKNIFYKLYMDAKTNRRLRNAASHYNNVGLCYLKMNNLGEAEKVFISIITLYPDNEKACLNLGLLYKLSGNSGLALDFYKKALEINPNNLNAKAEVDKLQMKIIRKF
jgi:tetratricopeptide (TPR) repeat protein